MRRAIRKSNVPEYLEYRFTDISSATARIYYVDDSTNEVQLFSSIDGATWVEDTVTSDTPVATSSGWYRANFTASGLPHGTNFVRVQISNDARIWAPQIGQVSITYTNTSSLTDQLGDWSKAYAHTSGWAFDSSSASTYFDGDTTRAIRTSDTAQSVTYHLSNTLWLVARLYFVDTYSGEISFSTSPDGTTWTSLTANASTPVATADGWEHADFTADSAIPSGTNYVKIQLANESRVWAPQLSLVRLGGLAPAPDPRVMTTTLSTRDVPVAAYSVEDFGAEPNVGTDATEQFQNALDAAYYAGGGVVFAPAGQYIISGHLNVPSNVTLRGDWASPDDGGNGAGTILKAYENDGNSTGTPFITTHEASTVRDLSVWYPNQNNISSVHAYPYTIATGNGTHTGPTLIDLTLYNSFNGINLYSGAGTLDENIYGTILSQGVYEDRIGDISRLQGIYLRPKYWANSGLGTPPTESQITSYTRANATGVSVFRNDWGYAYDLYLEGFGTGFLVQSDALGGYNGQIQKLHTANGKIGLQVHDANYVGLNVINSTLDTSGSDGVSVLTQSTFGADETLAISNTSLSSPLGKIAELDGSGLVSFSHSEFVDWSSSYNAIAATAGKLIVQSSTFDVEKPDIHLESGVASAAVVGNAYAANSPDVTSLATGADIKINTDSSITPAATPALTTSDPSLATFRKPSSTNLYVVTDPAYGAAGDATTDDTSAFQAALNAAGGAGGGTVYVPAGRYNIAGHLSVPSGVELRGPNDGPRQYGDLPRGAVLLATENQGSPSATAFITLAASAGARGFSVFYPNQVYNDVKQYPPTIAGTGSGTWVEDVTLPDSYVGVKMTAGNYFIDYLRGIGLDTFIDISGVSSAGYIQNSMNTVGDWQDITREANAPIQSWWTFKPSFDGTGMKIDNSDNVNIFNTFSYGVGYGIQVSGTSSHVHVYGFGADDAEHGVELLGSGSDITFANTQITAIGGDGKHYIYTSSGFTGAAQFYNTAGWASTGGSEFDGSGSVTLEQYLDNPDAAGGGTPITQNAGSLYMYASSLNQSGTQVYLDAAITDAALVANAGSGGFGVTNNKGDPDVWLNVGR